MKGLFFEKSVKSEAQCISGDGGSRVYLLFLISLLFFATESGMAQSQDRVPTLAERKALFNYEKTDLGIKEIGSEKRGTVTVHDITFVGIPGKNPVKAYLVVPEGSGSFAGILWGHWLGHHTSDRNQYLDEAVDLASRGVVSLLIDAMWAEPGWYENRALEEDYENSIKQVIEMRRAMDLLMSRENVDQDRVAYVGHDYSGMYGSIAAGVEPRAKTYVFIAVTSSLTDWAFFANKPKSKVAYIRQNSVFELTDFVSELRGSVLCQFSNTDPFIARTDGNLFFNALTVETKERKRYDAEHFMGGDDIRADRTAWLIKELGLK
ncbi:MAG: hypothetical protein HEP71_00895 [Roseivirga sp.]|nr:hypothetical protein [Roseivirga sp.]